MLIAPVKKLREQVTILGTYDENSNGIVDGWSTDKNNNGIQDAVYVDENEDKMIEEGYECTLKHIAEHLQG